MVRYKKLCVSIFVTDAKSFSKVSSNNTTSIALIIAIARIAEHKIIIPDRNIRFLNDIGFHFLSSYIFILRYFSLFFHAFMHFKITNKTASLMIRPIPTYFTIAFVNIVICNRFGRIMIAKNVPNTIVIHKNARNGFIGIQLLITAVIEIRIKRKYMIV